MCQRPLSHAARRLRPLLCVCWRPVRASTCTDMALSYGVSPDSSRCLGTATVHIAISSLAWCLPATVGGGGCNRRWRGLQPHAYDLGVALARLPKPGGRSPVPCPLQAPVPCRPLSPVPCPSEECGVWPSPEAIAQRPSPLSTALSCAAAARAWARSSGAVQRARRERSTDARVGRSLGAPSPPWLELGLGLGLARRGERWRAATLCLPGCNPMPPGLQPYASLAATLQITSSMHARLQPCTHTYMHPPMHPLCCPLALSA